MHIFLVALLIAWSALTLSARADLTPPDVEKCRLKPAGTQCDDGVCVDATCSKLDYANWNRDASSAPPSMQYACVKCVAGGSAVDAGTGDAGAADAGGKKDKDSGCSTSRGSGAMAALWLALGLAYVARRRRLSRG